jgi:hypothetical protein
VTRLIQFFPTMAGCQTRENLPRNSIQINWFLTYGQQHHMPIPTIQPLLVQPFISRVNPEPASFGRGSLSQGYIRPQWKLEGLTKQQQQHADQIYTSKRWPKPWETENPPSAHMHPHQSPPMVEIYNWTYYPSSFNWNTAPSPHSASRDSRGALGVWDGPEVNTVPG